MSNFYYDRIAKIVIQNQNKIEIDNCRIKFEVRKSLIYNENTAEIEIFNLSKQTRDRIASLSSVVSIYAGYKNIAGLVEIGRGDIATVKTNRDLTEVVTQIFLVEGMRLIRGNPVSFSYTSDVKVSQILNNIREAGFVVRIIDFDTNQTIKDSYADMGTIDTVLNNLATQFNFVWSIQNSQVTIVGTNKPKFAKEVLVLTAKTGLILNPEAIQIVSRRIQKFSSKDPIQALLEGIPENSQMPNRKTHVIQAFLQPQLQVRDIIRVESSELNGLFQCQKITHKCDTHGAEWYTEIEVYPFNV